MTNLSKISFRLVLILCLLVLAIRGSDAQPKQLKFNYITTVNGLSSSMVLSIKQDHKGFMWIGTYDGLNRYDGQNFVVYKNEIDNPASLACDQISEIFEDRNNNLFIGTTCGLSLYDPDHDKFINFMFDNSSPLNGLVCNVYGISADSQENLWLSTNVGLIYFDWKNNTSKIYVHDENDPESLSNNWVEFTFIDSQGRLWVSTRGGLNLFQPQTKTFKPITKCFNSDEDFSNITFLKITEDLSGNIWFGSYNGLFCLENTSNDETLVHYSHDPDDPNSISGNRLLSVFADKQNNLWIGAENDGLFLFNREKQNFWHYQTNDYDEASLNNESVQAIYMDNSENLWIGTFGGGINLSPKNSEGIIHYKNLKGGDLSLSNNVVSSFHEDDKGRVWVGTDGGGLNLFDKVTKRFTRFNTNNSGLSSNVILSIAEDSKHNFWMGSWGGGLIKFNPDTRNFVAFNSKNYKIPDNNIFCVELGDNNDLWLASYRNGLIHFNIENNEFKSYTTDNSSIGNNYIYVIKKNSKGHLILGSTNGIKIFAPENESFTSYPNNTNNPNSISHGTVYDILIENDTCIWIGTQSGLNRFNPETGIFTRYYEKDGLPNNVIKGLVFDKTGILWVTTNGGVCRFDYKNNQLNSKNIKYDVFTKEDGLQSNEFNFKSTMLSSRGELFLGGVNGFNIINPEKITKNINIPLVVITDFEIFNKPVIPNALESPLITNISDTKEIKLKYNQSVLTFYFSVMDFTMPEKNQYAYMLENFDDGWIYSGKKNEATYTNLDPGEYIFRVKGSNNDALWNEEGTSIKIIILPPWWKTLIFRILIVVFFITGLIILFRQRIASLQNQRKQLELLVIEKTRVVLQQKEDIQNKKNELEIANATKDKFFSIIAHDLRGPFGSFLGLTEIMVEELETLTMDQIQKIAIRMNNSAINLFNLLENLLQWSRMQQGLFSFELKMVELGPIVDECIATMMESAKKKEIEITSDIQKDLVVYADSNVLQMVIRNLLSNAVKYSNKGGKVKFSAKPGDNRCIEISIKDTGIGMSEELVNNLFRIDMHTNRKGTEGEPSTGLGLIICKDFIEKQGGKLWVESEEKVGSVFHFSLPLSPEHISN